MVAGVLTGLRRGGRVAEGGGLLNRYTGITRIVGSNPIPSAIILPRALMLLRQFHNS